MDQHDVWRRQRVQKALRLRIVRVRAKADRVHAHPQRNLNTGPRRDMFRIGEDFLCECTLHRKVGDDDPVLAILAPRLEEVAGEPALEHRRRGEHNARTRLLKVRRGPAEVLRPFQVERVGHLERCPHVLVEHVDIRLKDGHAPASESGRLIDWHLLKLRVRLPKVLENEQELLRAPKRHHGQEHAPAALEDGGDAVREALLALLARSVRADAVCALHYDHVRRDGR
mmetsp:Transcript_7668/g.25382  ORF Transcript_7668/g.25382 Transcript_7668/m.25382 type:complete len:227 (-) Transcript_7668:628-1308(-)